MGVYVKVVLAVVAAALVCLLVPSDMLGIRNDAVPMLEAFLELVGGIYSVLTAFVIFVVWEQFNALQKLTVREGSLAAELPRLASLLAAGQDDARRRVASATRTYLTAAAAEWDELAALQESRAATAALDALDARVAELAATPTVGPTADARLSDALAALRECRVSRVSAAKHRMPATLNHLLALLSALLLAGLLLLPPGAQPQLGHAAFVCLAAVLTMIRAVVWDIDHPFVGVWRISKAPFEQAAGIPS
ncbi:MAG: DUF4239 domain-containing protein [Nannocystaceae bacterium]